MELLEILLAFTVVFNKILDLLVQVGLFLIESVNLSLKLVDSLLQFFDLVISVLLFNHFVRRFNGFFDLIILCQQHLIQLGVCLRQLVD